MKKRNYQHAIIIPPVESPFNNGSITGSSSNNNPTSFHYFAFRAYFYARIYSGTLCAFLSHHCDKVIPAICYGGWGIVLLVENNKEGVGVVE